MGLLVLFPLGAQHALEFLLLQLHLFDQEIHLFQAHHADLVLQLVLQAQVDLVHLLVQVLQFVLQHHVHLLKQIPFNLFCNY